MPIEYCMRMAETVASATGSPNSSRIRPETALPRGSATSAFSMTCASTRSIGRPGSNGRVWPYCIVTKPDFDTLTLNRPAGSFWNS